MILLEDTDEKELVLHDVLPLNDAVRNALSGITNVLPCYYSIHADRCPVPDESVSFHHFSHGL